MQISSYAATFITSQPDGIWNPTNSGGVYDAQTCFKSDNGDAPSLPFEHFFDSMAGSTKVLRYLCEQWSKILSVIFQNRMVFATVKEEKLGRKDKERLYWRRSTLIVKKCHRTKILFSFHYRQPYLAVSCEGGRPLLLITHHVKTSRFSWILPPSTICMLKLQQLRSLRPNGSEKNNKQSHCLGMQLDEKLRKRKKKKAVQGTTTPCHPCVQVL